MPSVNSGSRASLQSAQTDARRHGGVDLLESHHAAVRGVVDEPCTSKTRSLAEADLPGTTSATDIWLVVRVPVLSEQITEVHPSVSTLCSFRTMAFFLAILRVPSARQVVITAGRPSGMAATASATAILK